MSFSFSGKRILLPGSEEECITRTEITSFLSSKTLAREVVTIAENSLFHESDFTFIAPAKFENFRTAAWRWRISFARFIGSVLSGSPFTITKTLIFDPAYSSFP